MPREFHSPNPQRRRVMYRIVQHDRPEQLRLEPEIERELLLRDIGRKALALVAAAAVLGVTWALCEGILALIPFVRK